MADVFFLAWQYLRHHGFKTLVLIASMGLIGFLPMGLVQVVRQGADMLTARAEASPLLVGSRGSAVDLTLSALYFQPPSVDPISYGEVGRINRGGLATALPMHLRYQVGPHRIVGTSIEYFEFRRLQLGEGRLFSLLGECVLGAEAARRLGKGVGEQVLSTPAGAFDVAGSYPLNMQIVGVLEATGTPDDEAVWVDVKTAWVIAGLAHGHEDVVEAPEERLLRRDSQNVVASPAVLSYTEITEENRSSFHFHGDPSTYPIDAILCVPRDFRSGILLRGQYEAADGPHQVVVPETVIEGLLGTVFALRNLVVLGSVGVGLAALAIATLVFVLSIRLRAAELDTMRKIGASEGRIRAILALEIGLVLVSAILLAMLLARLVRPLGDLLLQWIQ